MKRKNAISYNKVTDKMAGKERKPTKYFNKSESRNFMREKIEGLIM